MESDKKANINITASDGGAISFGDNTNIGGTVTESVTPLPGRHSSVPLEIEPYDVFISYARADRDAVTDIADQLEQLGLTVWFDRKLQPGDAFLSQINARLQAAKIVLVVWTQSSIGSEWVLNEAEFARERDSLVSVMLEHVALPAPFKLRNAVDLSSHASHVDEALSQIANMCIAAP